MGSIFQSAEWAIQMQNGGFSRKLITVHQNNKLCAGCNVYRKNIPFLNLCILKIPYGPIWDGDNIVCLERLVDDLISYAMIVKAISLEFFVYLPESSYRLTNEIQLKLYNAVSTRGFHLTGDSIGTYIIDLNLPEEEIFSSFKKNHRRDIQKGVRENVRVSLDTGNDASKLIDTFYSYYLTTFQRKGLVPYPPQFFYYGIRKMVEAGLCRIFYASLDKTIYNVAIVSLFGTPTYIWGASIPTSGLPPMGQLLHWEVIKWLKTNGYNAYDLGGAPGPVPVKDDENYWVWRFKYGFGGRYYQSSSSYQIVFKPILNRFFQEALMAYRVLKKQISRLNR